MPDADKPEGWQFQIMPTWLADGKTHVGGAQGLAELKELAVHLAEPWKSSLLWIPDDTDVTYSSVSYWPTREWNSQGGRVTLAGDSAHPVPPHRGQGLNHGIADAHNFVKAVLDIKDRKKPRTVAIEEYNAELIKRGADEVETSRRNALLVHDFEVSYELGKMTPIRFLSCAVHINQNHLVTLQNLETQLNCQLLMLSSTQKFMDSPVLKQGKTIDAPIKKCRYLHDSQATPNPKSTRQAYKSHDCVNSRSVRI